MIETIAAVTSEVWRAEGRELFGDEYDAWAYQCPRCGNVATVGDWRDARVAEGRIVRVDAVGLDATHLCIRRPECTYNVFYAAINKGDELRAKLRTIIGPTGVEFLTLPYADPEAS